MATLLNPSKSLTEVVLDTDVLSFLYKGSDFAKVYKPYLQQTRIYISFQTVAEIYLWTQRANWGEKRIQHLLGHLNIYTMIHSSHKLAWRWAVLTENTRRKGKIIHPGDAWVAATALELGIPLVTNNTKDYIAVEDLELLSIKST